MANKIRALDIVVGDLIETPWNGTEYRVTGIKPSASEKIVQISTVVEVSKDPELAVGRVMRFGHRAGTLVWVQRAQTH